MSALPIPTVAELKELFAAHGVRPNRGRGQNFLVDARAMEFVAEAAELGPLDVVLEPGVGTGGLTGLLAEHTAAVVAVEIDRKLHAIAADRLRGLENVKLIHADILGPGGTLTPQVRDAVESALRAAKGARLKVVANLPYRVSTALLTTLLVDGPVPAEMVVMVQDEVGDRICAAARSPDYGYLSVVVQSLARTARLRRLSPQAFWPPPAVDSCVLRITPDVASRPSAEALAGLRSLASELFGHRRKQVAGSLVKAGLAADRHAAEQHLADVGASEGARPEELSVEQLTALAQRLAGR